MMETLYALSILLAVIVTMGLGFAAVILLVSAATDYSDRKSEERRR